MSIYYAGNASGRMMHMAAIAAIYTMNEIVPPIMCMMRFAFRARARVFNSGYIRLIPSIDFLFI